MIIRIFIAALLLIVIDARANSKWELITTSVDNDEFFIDANSYQRSGDSITFWARRNFGKRDIDGDLSSKSQLTINCRTRERIGRYFMTYDEINNLGKNTYSAVSKSSWTPIAPDTINWALMMHVCK
jgi:hypothetical protein